MANTEEYVEIDECVAAGTHLQDCDNDGFCNYCGYQDMGTELPEAVRDRVLAYIKENANKPVFRVKGSDNDLLIVRFKGEVTYTIECPVNTEQEFIDRTFDAALNDVALMRAIIKELPPVSPPSVKAPSI